MTNARLLRACSAIRDASLRRSAGYFVFFVVVGLLARLTVIGPGNLSLIWPGAGVAALWLGTSSRSRVAVDIAGVVVATLLVNGVTGASWSLLTTLVAANLAGAGSFVVIGRRHLAGLWGLGGRDQLVGLHELGWIVVTCTASSSIAAAIGSTGVVLAGDSASAGTAVSWWARSGVGTLTVVLLAMLAIRPVLRLRRGHRLEALRDRARERGRRNLAEAAALLAITAGLLTVVIANAGLGTQTYLLVLCSVWAGLRLPPGAAAVHGELQGGALLVATLVGWGPFATNVSDPREQVLFAQGFLVVTLLTGLVLAMGRDDLERTGEALAAAQLNAAAHTTLLDAVLTSMKEGLVVVDADGTVPLHNPSALRLLGLPEDTTQDTTPERAVTHLLHPDGRPVQAHDLPGHRALAGEEISGADFHVRSPEIPHGRIVEISAQLLEGDENDPRRAMVNIRDVTAERQHRDALASFAGTVAHDLYTPLTMISGWAEALIDDAESGAPDPALTHLGATRIQRSALHMRDVIRDLLAYTVARDQSLLMADVDLSALLEDLAELRRDSPANPRIRIQPGMVVRADHALIRQLFDNLIGNAVKYVAEGVVPRIEVTAEEDAEHEQIEIRVTDNGVGIAVAQREHVFAPYHRLDATGRGTGLGLAICRRIVDRHGGTLHVEDAPGGGTSMVVRLPDGSAPGEDGAPDEPQQKSAHMRDVPLRPDRDVPIRRR